MKFSDLSVGDYVWWSEQKPNMGGDYDLVFGIRKLSLDDFAFMSENGWNEYDLNEFVKPVEITHKVMAALGWPEDEELAWGGITVYSFKEYAEKAIKLDSHSLVFDLDNKITVEMASPEDEVRNIGARCFNRHGSFGVTRIKPPLAPHYLHELQHLMRDCGVEAELSLPDDFHD